MRIDFLTRLTSAIAITLGLLWAFMPSSSWLPAITLIFSGILYFIGVFGSSPRIRETRGYPIVLISLSVMTVLTGLVGLVQVDISMTDVIGQALVTCLFFWFCRTLLSVLRSHRSPDGNVAHGAA